MRRRDDFAWTAKSPNLSGRESNGVRASSSDTPKRQGPIVRVEVRFSGNQNREPSCIRSDSSNDSRRPSERASREVHRAALPIGNAGFGIERSWATQSNGNRWDRNTGAVKHLSFADCETKHLVRWCAASKTVQWRASMTGALHVVCVGNPREPLETGGVLERAGGVLRTQLSCGKGAGVRCSTDHRVYDRRPLSGGAYRIGANRRQTGFELPPRGASGFRAIRITSPTQSRASRSLARRL